MGTNKRMSVPQQKKPKQSFEEALFGGCPPSVAMKRHSQNVEKAASNKAPKKHANQPAKEKKLKKEKKSNDTQYYDRKNTVTAQRSDHDENSKISSTSPVPIKSNVRDTSKQQKIDENHPCEAKLKIHSTQKKVKQEDTTNQLFFCYNCKSIFISSGALEAHKIKMGHH